VRQWQDEREAKLGLPLTVGDRNHLAESRRERGYGASAWAAGSCFIISHALLADDTYLGGLRDVLRGFRPKDLRDAGGRRSYRDGRKGRRANIPRCPHPRKRSRPATSTRRLVR
jgi:hypothetical protein